MGTFSWSLMVSSITSVRIGFGAAASTAQISLRPSVSASMRARATSDALARRALASAAAFFAAALIAWHHACLAAT